MIQLSGCVNTVIFSNPDSNYAVVLLNQTDGDVIVTGPLADLAIGDYIQVSGAWVSHPVHKQQFKVAEFSQLVPATDQELLLFLSTGVITGIGPHFAKILVDHFGKDLVQVLDHSPDQLLQVSGIGETKLTQIKQSWKSQREQLSFLKFILDKGLELNIGKRIWREYYSDAFEKCEHHPYSLINSIQGMTFPMADQLANDSQRFSSTRLNAAILDVFNDYFKTSNVWMKYDLFFEELNRRIDWPDSDLIERLQELTFQQDLQLVRDENDEKWVTSQMYSQIELNIMNALDQLICSPVRIDIDHEKAVEWVLPKLSCPLSEDQVLALEGLLSSTVAILFGGPGTGKTTMLHAFVKICAKKTDRIVCMAPTGKAAKRLAEQIGRRASTIHAMMDYDEKTHSLSPKDLDCDICIIDEMSMVDMHLFLDVMAMLPLGARLIMVGDPDQLPSIGPGQVFADLISNSSIPSFKLVTNHRQVTHRGITSLASNVLLNQPVNKMLGKDLTLIDIHNDEDLEATLLDLFLYRVIRDHSISMNDIQLIIPIHKGRFGISSVNQLIAAQVRGSQLSTHQWVLGDRVIQCRNNYSKRVMNGDIGFIREIKPDQILIEFQHGVIPFEHSEMIDIQLAYAVSIHKFQGSEAPVVILPIIKQWGFFMSKDVLYTAITRAKSHLYIVGDMTVFNRMVCNAKSPERWTRLYKK
ncbi:MAG: AAA family ATPase [Candidatus Margulisiibacteriota bacterium]